MPATNVVSYVMFQRKVRDLRDPNRLLDSLTQESQFYKRWRFGVAMLDSLKVLKWMPGELRLVLNFPRCLSTAILSYIGDPSLAILANFPVNADGNPIMGNLVFDDLNTAPPIRPRTHPSRRGTSATSFGWESAVTRRSSLSNQPKGCWTSLPIA